MNLPKLIATSVVRGSEKGQSHGGVYTIDFDSLVVEQHIDWNDGEIVEILGVISLFGFLNRWNDSMGTTIEEDAVSSGKQYLEGHGWDEGKHNGSAY